MPLARGGTQCVTLCHCFDNAYHTCSRSPDEASRAFRLIALPTFHWCAPSSVAALWGRGLGLRFKCLSRSYPDTLRYVVSRRSGRAPSLRALTRKMGGEVVLPLTPSGARRSREWPAPHFAPALAHLERAPAHVADGVKIINLIDNVFRSALVSDLECRTQLCILLVHYC